MKHLLKVSALTVALVTTANFAVISDVQAAKLTKEQIEERKKKKTQVLSPRPGKYVAKAFDLYSEDKVDEAIDVLLEIKPSGNFDKAYVARFIGNMYAGMEGKTKLAIKYIKQALEPDLLNFKEQADTIKLLGDLYLQEKQYKDAVKAYQDWMDFTGEEDESVYTRMASAYYELKQYDKIIAPSQRAIKLQEKPKLAPYQLIMASYYERKQYKNAVKAVEIIVKTFPTEKRWWATLGQFYMLTEDYKKALSAMELAYKQGYLEKESEIKALAQLYATNDIPYKSALIQEKFLQKNGKGLLERNKQAVSVLANTWHAAKNIEKAARYYGEAAAFDNDPELYRKQGSLLNQAEQFSKAVPVLKKALEHGVKKEGRVYMSLAEAYFYQNKFKDAYAMVKEAQKDSSTTKVARSWANFIKEKASRHGVRI